MTTESPQSRNKPIGARTNLDLRVAALASYNPDPLGLRQCPATFGDFLIGRRCQMNSGGRIRRDRDLERQEPIVSRPARRDLTADTLVRRACPGQVGVELGRDRGVLVGGAVALDAADVLDHPLIDCAE